ncbi:MAG: hypothetical protein KAQ99_03615 [Candidatus Aureabacteria bacterium]|nr:hypothetical protein [Candidatus Auribacterota bacterium]MCK5160642.1 hypothetical protein [Candidatus Auribacterota bacterium]
MAQKRPFTPEKQLLKLIEDQTTAGDSQAKLKKIKPHRIGMLSLGWWISRFSFLKERLKKRRLLRRKTARPDIKTINRALALLVFVLLVYSIYFVNNLYTSMINLKKLPRLDIEPGGREPFKESPAVLSSLRETGLYYLEKARERDIFKMGMKPTAETEEVTSSPSSRIIQVTQNLGLVGISWSSDPDAMVEDKKALKTFFVKEGDMIGKVRVETILRDRLVLSFEGERTELK